MADFDRNRDFDRDPRADARVPSDYGFGIPVIIIAAILIIGGLWYANVGSHVTTAANNPTPTTQTGSVGNPVPGPTTTAPAPNR